MSCSEHHRDPHTAGPIHRNASHAVSIAESQASIRGSPPEPCCPDLPGPAADQVHQKVMARQNCMAGAGAAAHRRCPHWCGRHRCWHCSRWACRRPHVHQAVSGTKDAPIDADCCGGSRRHFDVEGGGVSGAILFSSATRGPQDSSRCMARRNADAVLSGTRGNQWPCSRKAHSGMVHLGHQADWLPLPKGIARW